MNDKPLFELSSLWVSPVLTIQRKDGSTIEVELICFEATEGNRGFQEACDKVGKLASEKTEAAGQGEAVCEK